MRFTIAKNLRGVPEGFSGEVVTVDEADALTTQVAKLEEQTGNDVDRVVHYRNLAIDLGAKPEQMLDKFDRDLVARWGKNGYTAAEQNEHTALLWDENERLELQVTALEAEIEAAASDCAWCRNPSLPRAYREASGRWVHDQGLMCAGARIRERAYQRTVKEQP